MDRFSHKAEKETKKDENFSHLVFLSTIYIFDWGREKEKKVGMKIKICTFLALKNGEEGKLKIQKCLDYIVAALHSNTLQKIIFRIFSRLR
jgi:hypothetical protein